VEVRGHRGQQTGVGLIQITYNKRAVCSHGRSNYKPFLSTWTRNPLLVAAQVPRSAIELTPTRRVIIDKIIVAHLLKEFLAVYETRIFIATFTKARY
jgi:hypothetical protein